MRPFIQLLCGIVWSGIANSPQAADVPWPQWRGPQRNGTVATAAWPDTVNEQRLVLQWRVPLAPGYSGPIVASDRVFVLETVDRSSERALALDREDGHELWQTSWPGSISVPFFAKANGDWIRSTPAFDGERLYVAGMEDVLVCLDSRKGVERWRKDFVQELTSERESFGFVCSPLIDEGFVYTQCGAGLIKLAAATGEVVWRTLDDGGGMLGGAFSSPLIATIAGQRQLVVQTRTRLAGVDLETGLVLWSVDVEAFRGMNILTPTVIGDRVFTSAYGGGSVMVAVSREGSQFSVEQVWKSTTQGYMSSPVVVDGYIYLHLRNQRFTCLDPQTGDSLWTTQPFGKYWSLVTHGERILALDEKSQLLLIRANPREFELLDRRDFGGETTWAHLAVAGDQVFVRALDELRVYRWSE